MRLSYFDSLVANWLLRALIGKPEKRRKGAAHVTHTQTPTHTLTPGPCTERGRIQYLSCYPLTSLKMASSHHNGDDSFHNNYFESNNYFSNLDPSLVNPHDDLSEQAWSIQPNQLNIARGFQPSERQQWQNTPPPLSNAAPATSYMDQNGQFGRAYSSAATQFQNVHVSQNLYNTYQQSPYDPSIISPSTTSASRYGFPNAAVPVAGRQNRTIAPEALQTLPVHSRTSVTPQPQVCICVSIIAGAS